MSKAWARGSTRAWRRVRAQVLARDGYRCQVKHPDICKTVADCVHHVDGRDVSGDNPDRCVASCTPCNLREGDVRSNDPEPNVRAWWLIDG